MFIAEAAKKDAAEQLNAHFRSQSSEKAVHQKVFVAVLQGLRQIAKDGDFDFQRRDALVSNFLPLIFREDVLPANRPVDFTKNYYKKNPKFGALLYKLLFMSNRLVVPVEIPVPADLLQFESVKQPAQNVQNEKRGRSATEAKRRDEKKEEERSSPRTEKLLNTAFNSAACYRAFGGTMSDFSFDTEAPEQVLSK